MIGNCAITVFAAMVAHEANRHYCRSIGDHSLVEWENAPSWQRNSAIAGAEMIEKNPETTPEQSHESWMALKGAEGWVYGPVKDVEKKEHPCMVPYNELPAVQRLKDQIFGNVVRAILKVAESDNEPKEQA